MDRAERREFRRRKRLFKKRRKKYAAEERSSVRKLNKEMRQKITAQRLKHRKQRLNQIKDLLLRIFLYPFRRTKSGSLHDKEMIPQEMFKAFSGPEEKKEKRTGNKHMSLFSRRLSKMEKEEKQRLREQRKKFRERRLDYLMEERKSIRRERNEMRRDLVEMHRRITLARIEGYRQNFIKFLKNPVKTRKVEGAEKALRKQVRQDIKKLRLIRLKQMPSQILQSIQRFWLLRYKQVRDFRRNASGFASLVKDAWSIPSLRKGNLQNLLNSSVFFILSFFFVYYLYQFTTIFTAQAFNIPSKLFSYRIDWPLYTYSYLYTRVALVVIFGSGPLVCLIFGFLFYWLYLWARAHTHFTKMFFLWACFHAFNLFFGSYISGVLTRTGFIYTSEWLFISNMFDVEEIIFMVISIVVLLIIGYFATKQFLHSASSARLIEPKYRTLFILSQVVIPWFIGNLVLYFSNSPNNPIELALLYVTSVLMIIPVLAGYNITSLQRFNLLHTSHEGKTGWVFLFILAGLIITIKIFLTKGISFI